jgi:hypothetical protein
MNILSLSIDMLAALARDYLTAGDCQRLMYVCKQLASNPTRDAFLRAICTIKTSECTYDPVGPVHCILGTLQHCFDDIPLMTQLTDYVIFEWFLYGKSARRNNGPHRASVTNGYIWFGWIIKLETYKSICYNRDADRFRLDIDRSISDMYIDQDPTPDDVTICLSTMAQIF